MLINVQRTTAENYPAQGTRVSRSQANRTTLIDNSRKGQLNWRALTELGKCQLFRITCVC